MKANTLALRFTVLLGLLAASSAAAWASDHDALKEALEAKY